jgi:hypothetical protein
LVDPADPGALADAIGRLLVGDRLNARVRAGARGLNFDWDQIVEAVTAGRLRE